MKILQIFGAVVAVHLLAFIFIFASPGCQSSPRNVPTPDATLPAEASSAPAPITYNANATPQPVDLGTAPAYSSPGSSGHNVPTRPGSPAAAAVAPSRATEDVAPVSTYTIAKGDSLWSVAKKNHLSVSELAKANNLPTGAALKPGKKLIIPGKVAPPAPAKEVPTSAQAGKPAAAAADKSAAPAESVKHTVQNGESLGVIARKYQISVGELAAVNNITDPSKVRAGQQLIIPGFKAVGAKNNSPATNRTPTAAKSSAPVPTATSSGANSSSATAASPATNPAAAAPHYEITAPPPGQDLDAGLKDPPAEVPTIKVEEATTEKK